VVKRYLLNSKMVPKRTYARKPTDANWQYNKPYGKLMGAPLILVINEFNIGGFSILSRNF
jgi:hypothetical protein